MSIWNEVKESFAKGTVITKLIYVNVALFVLIRLADVFAYLLGSPFSLLPYFTLPANLDELWHRPWTIVSYMFMHAGFLHLLFNMLWLYWMGELFLRYFTPSQLLGVYLMGGLSGAVCYLLLYNISPSLGEKLHVVQLLGASGSVLAIASAVGTYAPNHPIRLFFIGEIKMKHLVIASFVIYLLGMSGTNAGGNIAHVGGLLLGFLFVLSYRKGNDFTRWVLSLIAFFDKLFTAKPKIRVSYRNPNQQQRAGKKRSSSADQMRINEVLNKARQMGYESLSKEEKELLFRN